MRPRAVGGKRLLRGSGSSAKRRKEYPRLGESDLETGRWQQRGARHFGRSRTNRTRCEEFGRTSGLRRRFRTLACPQRVDSKRRHRQLNGALIEKPERASATRPKRR